MRRFRLLKFPRRVEQTVVDGHTSRQLSSSGSHLSRCGLPQDEDGATQAEGVERTYIRRVRR